MAFSQVIPIFHDEVNVALTHISTAAVTARLAINAGKLTAVTNLITGPPDSFNSLYTLYVDNSSNTKAVVRAIPVLRNEIQHAFSDIINDAPASAFLEVDRDKLKTKKGLPHTHTAGTGTNQTPMMEFIAGNDHQILVRWKHHTGAPGVDASRGMLPGAAHLELVWIVVPAGDLFAPHLSPTDCNYHLLVDTQGEAIEFLSSQSGSQMVGFARWIMKPNKPGPFSALFRVVIP